MRLNEFFRGERGPDRLAIGATVAPAKVKLNAVLHYLAGRDGARAGDAVGGRATHAVPGRTAILTESNTGFGTQFAAYGH